MWRFHFPATAPALVIDRLLALGRLKPEDAVSLEPLRTSPPAAPDAGSVVSERFTRLALEARARGALTLDELSEYLETDPATARDLADRFRLDAGGADESPEAEE